MMGMANAQSMYQWAVLLQARLPRFVPVPAHWYACSDAAGFVTPYVLGVQSNRTEAIRRTLKSVEIREACS